MLLEAVRYAPSMIALLAATGLVSTARADTTQPISWRTVGASHHTAIDLDGKGDPASFSVAEGDGTFGPASVQGMFEPAQVPIEKCGPGAILEYHPVAGTMVRTFRPSLDQIFIKTVSGLACIFEDGTVTSESHAVITGGTGRFEGATGTLVTKTLPQTVTFPEWKGNFNNVINLSEGTITLRH